MLFAFTMYKKLSKQADVKFDQWHSRGPLTLAISSTLCLPARSWDGTLAIHHNLIDVKCQPRTASYGTWNQNWSLHWTRETLQVQGGVKRETYERDC